jgi:hypothetical protein
VYLRVRIALETSSYKWKTPVFSCGACLQIFVFEEGYPGLAMAPADKDLDGVIVVHGSLGTRTPARPGDIKDKILVLNGADVPFVPAEQVAAFEK